jgi:hypothetical protein
MLFDLLKPVSTAVPDPETVNQGQPSFVSGLVLARRPIGAINQVLQCRIE